MILLKLAILAVSGLFFLAVTATALAGFLVMTGTPRPCVDRAVQPAPAPNPVLQANWSSAFERANAGEAVALSVTEDQAATLADGHLADKDVPIDDFVVLFCPDGSTEAFGTVKVAGVSTEVLVKGRLDITEEQPVIEIETIKAGNLPGGVAKNLLDLAWDGERARTLPLTLGIYSLDVSDGEAIVVIGP